jgi:hypothetical protein
LIKSFRNLRNTITGTRIFLNYNLINEFEAKYKRYQAKNKDSKKLEAFFKRVIKLFPEVKDTYELNSKDDIKIIEQSISFYDLDSSSPEFRIVKAAKKAQTTMKLEGRTVLAYVDGGWTISGTVEKADKDKLILSVENKNDLYVIFRDKISIVKLIDDRSDEVKPKVQSWRFQKENWKNPKKTFRSIK